MPQPIITIFGATGFIGRQVVRAFAGAGWVVRAVSRNAQKAYFLKPCGDVGQVVPMGAHCDDAAGIAACVAGADAVVYLPGVLYASAKGFERVHAIYPAQIAAAAFAAGVDRFIHVSALGCDVSQALYAASKRDGETAVRRAFPAASILRPSIVVGPEDGFFARFAGMARSLPFLPLIGGGHTRFQPVYAGDVAKAVLAAATLPPHGHQNPLGRIYELGGPEITTFRAMLETMFHHTGQRRTLLPMPFALASLAGAVMQLLPVPPLTMDQVRSLKTDSVVSSGSFGLADLGIAATPINAVLPKILSRFRDGGPAAHTEKAA